MSGRGGVYEGPGGGLLHGDGREVGGYAKRAIKVVFLDIDGVLNNPGCYAIASGERTPAEPSCVAALNRITDETGAVIVVSSTWRHGGLMFMREKLHEWGVTGMVIDITPWLKNKNGITNSPRGHEIGQWLVEMQDWRHVESFVILDDDSDMEGHLSRLVQTDGSVGLTMADAERAIKMLAAEYRAKERT